MGRIGKVYVTPANLEIRRGIMGVVPTARVGALTAQDIAKCLRVAPYHVTASLRGMFMSNAVGRCRKSKKTRYWKVEV